MREFFPHLSTVSVDGKQHLSEVVFSALVGFSLYTTSTHHRVNQSPKSATGMSSSPTWYCAAQKTGVVVNRQLVPPSRQHTSTFHALDSDFLVKNQTLGWLGFQRSWYAFFYFSSNENPTRARNATSLNWCFSSTEGIHRRKKFTYVYKCPRSPHASARHWNPRSFRKKSRILF